AIVTGGAGGIGSATVRKLASRGINVLIADRNEASGTKLAEEIKRDYKVDAIFHRTDINKEEDIKSMVEATVKAWGRLDYAANIAGICPDGNELRDDESKVTTDIVESVFNTNQRGLWLCQKYEALQMKSQEPREIALTPAPAAPINPQRGSIVNISSTTGVIGMGFAAYSPTKHAVIGITRNGAYYYGPHGIRCNSVAPGGTMTTMALAAAPEDQKDVMGTEIMELVKPVPLKVYAAPEEQASVISFLLSPESSHVNAVNIMVDGGL
ncbi:3-oxoacyl-reductase, partial [Ilyonectria sp. MPI-CAGE-AT-0026]